MKKIIILALNFIILLLSLSFVYSDTNGIWSYANDIQGGTFGFDEGDFLSSYIFISPVFNNNNLTVTHYISSSYPILENHSANKKYYDDTLGLIASDSIICAQGGKIFNGSNCIYARGVDVIPDSFSFSDLTGVEFNSFVNSSEVILLGFDVVLDFTLSSIDTTASIIKNDIDVGTSTTVVSGDRIKFRMKSLNDFELISNLNYQLEGNDIESWSVKTKADKIQVFIDSDVMNFNLYTNQSNPTSVENYEVIINEGVKIGSTSTSNAAFTTGNLPSGSTVSIINNGKIMGRGGDGGSAPPCVDCHNQPGRPGGDAINIFVDTEIENNGEIWSGGGGGTGSSAWWQYGASGGGGAGIPGGIRGPRGANGEGNRGYDGTEFIGGNGGFNQPSHEWMYGGKGGDPGERGWSSCGYRTSMTCSKSGAVAGYSVKTNGNSITWITQGDLRGSIN